MIALKNIPFPHPSVNSHLALHLSCKTPCGMPGIPARTTCSPRADEINWRAAWASPAGIDAPVGESEEALLVADEGPDGGDGHQV